MLPFTTVYLTLCLISMSGEGWAKKTAAKNSESVHCHQFPLGRLGTYCLG